ncbi:GntR family transcriptional regulator [Streptomyces avermitilis]|uniref:GntR family transcriptional regulator n=1 Tax=Streptomyces avermitilis TaxID=33903 RepID=A0A4D4MH49_STRAX|nr:PLP-dependent aminotransferase family protein [Streptomyces avermitilis]OOV16410.1 GntR family transcriptional regulator [Streptomyces avermitilis]GDY68269.1 GntR family transcriptional regulator [Streptomyces avermitilis]GDY71368.1 GntR family transcriptional regulator [Streptomyces avermitilis]
MEILQSEIVRAELRAATLHASLTDVSMESMNFLNQVADTYPDAISFAAGRPYEGFYDVDRLHAYLRTFCDHLRDERHMSETAVARALFQYGATKGIITDLVARGLAVDEGIEADPASVVVTVGCQEAMFLVLRALRADDSDALLAPIPAYVGLTGAALLADMPVLPVRTGDTGIDLDDLVEQVRRARAEGRRVRACYVTPDFANPAGVSLPLADRHRLLDIAATEDLLLLEDNAYGLLTDPAGRPPTLKALDRRQQVVYLGSFAKTAMPGARVGYVVADQRVTGVNGETSLLADELAKLKSMLTVNTAPIAQAVIGGKLLDHGCSLVAANQRETEVYQRNLHQVLDGLTRRFGHRPDITWNAPTGGFFIVLSVPFTVDDDLLAHAARRYGVLFTPMRHFYGATGGFRQLRLSISTLTPDRIEEGLDRLAALLDERLNAGDGAGNGEPLSGGTS